MQDLRVVSYGRSESSPKSNLKVISQWHLLARLSSRTTSLHLPWIHCAYITARCAYGTPDCPARKCHGYPVSQGSANRKKEHCTESITEMESRGCCRIPVRARERGGWVGHRRLVYMLCTRARGSCGVALIGRHLRTRQIEEYAVT